MAKKATEQSESEQPSVEELLEKIRVLEQTHLEVTGESNRKVSYLEEKLAETLSELDATKAHRDSIANDLSSAKACIEQEESMAEYVNPDPKQGAGQRPRRLRPRQPTGRWLAAEPLELAVKAPDGNPGRRRFEIGEALPSGTPDEVLATLERSKAIEPEYVEAD
jgi:hypothetical protein